MGYVAVVAEGGEQVRVAEEKVIVPFRAHGMHAWKQMLGSRMMRLYHQCVYAGLHDLEWGREQYGSKQWHLNRMNHICGIA